MNTSLTISPAAQEHAKHRLDGLPDNFRCLCDQTGKVRFADEWAWHEHVTEAVLSASTVPDVAAMLAEHSPPSEVLTCLGDAWGLCGCGERFDLTVTDDTIDARELADWWRSHVADLIGGRLSRPRSESDD